VTIIKSDRVPQGRKKTHFSTPSVAPPGLLPFLAANPTVETVGYFLSCLRHWNRAVCFYILANPIRAGLIKESERWPFCGAVIPGYPRLHPLDEDFWPKFWKIFGQARQPEAGDRKLPPRNQQKQG
jgi:hypothetical protein